MLKCKIFKEINKTSIVVLTIEFDFIGMSPFEVSTLIYKPTSDAESLKFIQ